MAHAPEQSRYELRLDGAPIGIAVYRARDGVLEFTHTEIEPAFEGRGLGTVLVRGALDDVRRQELAFVPVCPFVRYVIEQHPEYQELLKR